MSTVCVWQFGSNKQQQESKKDENTEQNNEIGSAVLSDTPNTLNPILLYQYNIILQMTQLKNFWGEPNDRPHKVEGPCLNRTFNAAVSSSIAN